MFLLIELFFEYIVCVYVINYTLVCMKVFDINQYLNLLGLSDCGDIRAGRHQLKLS